MTQLWGTKTPARYRVPALVGGPAHGRPMDFPDPWPVRYAEAGDHDVTYAVFYAWDPELWAWVEFFAPADATDNMRDGWLASWRRKHPDWPQDSDIERRAA